MNKFSAIWGLALSILVVQAASAEPRARDLGVPFEGEPGPLNAITDVPGVEVGHTTLISGSGPLIVGHGPVRTGVTAILPRGKSSRTPVHAGWFTLNAAGEMTGTTWLEERGVIDGPVMITNTHSVGVVRDAVVAWLVENEWPGAWFAPVVAETWDGLLNDLNGFHVLPIHATQAIESATSGPVPEGAVGGGTGMVCAGFKGGIGTSSRRIEHDDRVYTVGVLVQCNYGAREHLRIAGAPVGQELIDSYLPCRVDDADIRQRCAEEFDGSIIVVVATDVPLLPHQLRRVAKRPALGIGRLGSVGRAGSGDIFIAFSTGNTQTGDRGSHPVAVDVFPNAQMSEVFAATVQATEEAVVNALVGARTMTGANDVRVYGLPHEELQRLLIQYNRWVE